MFHGNDSAISGHFRWAAVIALTLALCSRAVPDDKSPEASQSPAASQTVDRIVRGWKEREDRTKSLHCVWNSEQSRTAKPGGRVRLAATKNDVWLGRDAQYRFETTTERTDRATRRTETTHQWTVFDGRAYSTLKWAERSTLPRRGRVFDFGRKSLGYLDQELTPLAWVYRPSLRADLKPDQFTLVTEDALLEGLRCAKLRHRQGQTLSSFWFDPRRGDALVFWQWEVAGSVWSTLSLRYQSGNANGPTRTPTGWTIHNRDGSDDVSQVKTLEINNDLPADAFQIKFPPGTAVAVDLRGSTQEAYVVQPDGTKRPLFNLNTISSPQLRAALLQQTDFTIEPEPLRDAIDFLHNRYAIAIEMDAASFRKGKIDPSLEVQEDTAAIRFWAVLSRLSAQCPRPFGIFERKGGLVLKAID
jgi:hypothetical protein